MQRVAIDVLGALRVHIDGTAVAVDGRVRRRLLGLLVARRGLETRADWLADALWDGHPPEAAAATLHSHIAHLRRRLEPERVAGTEPRVLRTVPGGYLLAAESVDVDADRLVALVREAEGEQPPRALALVEAALALPRGAPYEDLADVVAVEADAARLRELLLTTGDLRLDLLRRLGRFDDLRCAAAAAVASDPLREGPSLVHAEVLAATGRAPEALRVLATLRRNLAEETGLEPSAAIYDAEQRILQATGPDTLTGAAVTWPPRDRSAPPPLRYAVAPDGVAIAYQEVGQGPAFVAVPPLAQNIEICWQDDQHRRLIERAAARCRFVHFDKRGTGMSDRAAGFTIEDRLGDFLAVLDATGVDRAVVCGVSEAGPLAIAFASAHPDRVEGLYLVNTFARVLVADDYPIGVTAAQYEAVTAEWQSGWGGDDGRILEWFAPTRRGERAYEAWFGHYMRQSCSPGTLAAINRANGKIDVRHLLDRIRAPTVVVHRIGDRVVPVSWGRYLAEHIPGATLRLLDGDDHLPWVGATWTDVIDGGIDLRLATA